MLKAIPDIEGFKFSFWSNENDEPIHVHVYKAGAVAKFWIQREVRLDWNKALRSRNFDVYSQFSRSNSMPSKGRAKLTFKSKIDPRLIPTDSAPGFEIADVKVTESAVEVWLSDGRIIITPLSWYPTLEAATPKQRRGFENLGVGLAWEELDLHLSVEGMLTGKREFRRPSHAVA